jgi:hypothetical protein
VLSHHRSIIRLEQRAWYCHRSVERITLYLIQLTVQRYLLLDELLLACWCNRLQLRACAFILASGVGKSS